MPRIRTVLLCFALVGIFSLLARTGQTAPAANWMWIWAAEDPRIPDTVFFRHRFRLPQKPLSAKLRIVADDNFRAFLNEGREPVAVGNDWTTVREFDLTRFLKSGDNLLAIEVTNTAGPGGLLYKLLLTYPGNRTQMLYSDARVRVNRRPPPVWTTLAFDDKNWSAAREIAPANGGTWGRLRGAPDPDLSRLVRIWDIRAGNKPGESPYNRVRNVGDRMLLSTNVSSVTETHILANAGFTLFQSDSDHLSTEETGPGQWNWNNADAQRRAVRRQGLDWAYFPHYAFPPAWYRQSTPFTRLQCLEHGQPIQAFSLWDPTWPAFIERGYDALAKAFPPRQEQNANNPEQRDVSALVVGVHGDYGEAGMPIGARTSVPGQREDWIARFGDAHNHIGFWCSDPLARADFRSAMLKKYGTLDALNAAWKRLLKSPDEIAYPQKPRGDARTEWLDFIQWYQNAVGQAIEFNLSAARKRYPDTLLMLPAGFVDEDVRVGNDNSLIPKIAAKYKAAVRSTHSGLKPFAENAATVLGRLGSACRFYDVPFWLEPPGNLTPEQETERLFEAVSQGASGLFDWAGNGLAYRDLYYRYGKFLKVEKPIVDVAMFYPAAAQKARPTQGYAPLFASACALLRDVTNYDIVDDRMVLDGCLANYRVLVLWEGTLADQETLDKIKAWVNDGGTLLAYDFGRVATLDGDLSWHKEMFGYANELAPAKVNERYIGTIPAQYRLNVGLPEAADYLNGDWYAPLVDGAVIRRWAGANASIRLPVNPERRYTLAIRVSIPPFAAMLKRRVLFNGREIGALETPGEITYRFPITEDMLDGKSLATLSLQSDTFQPSALNPESKDTRKLGVLVQTVQMIAEGTKENKEAVLPPGSLRRELDFDQLQTGWSRRFGKGLTVYFPARRTLLSGYLEVIRFAIYNLSAIDPGRRNALPVDNAQDGVYATLFTDKILYYNSKDTEITKTVTLSPETLAAWRGEVAMPTESTWKLTLEPHGIGVIYLKPPPVELLFECEDFKELGGLKPVADFRCSPGMGPSAVRLSKGAAITTRFLTDTPGRYALYVRALRNEKPEPVEVLLDGQPVAATPALAGQTYFSGVLPLSKGQHTLTLRARQGRDVLADFVLLTNDPTIAGYDFAIRTAPVE